MVLLESTHFPLIWLTLLMIVFMESWTQGETGCPTGRFGQQCKYKCHCASGSECDGDDGSCSPGVSCERGWFGPACQYFDLTKDSVVEPSNVAHWIKDGDDTTCINWNIKTVTVKWEDGISYYFSWMRLHVANASVLHNFTISFNGSTDVTCNEQWTTVIDEKTLDIHCKVDHPINEVNLAGAGVKRLCSVHISGGRNVALWRNTSQSSTYTGGGVSFNDSASSNAADGNPSGDFYGDRSCTHTKGNYNSWWQVNLQPSVVNRYVIYNRDSHAERLKGFILQRYGDQTTPLFEHVDTSDEQAVYRFNDVSRMGLAERIKIYLPRSDILTLCEVEIYGDSSCEPLRCQNSLCHVYYYGRDCDQKCNCHVEEQCFVSTGTCPSGCAAGFYGEGCGTETTTATACPAGMHGLNCDKTCPEHCLGGTCSREVGFCTGCEPGWQGVNCDKECGAGKYGSDCAEFCSIFCSNGSCDKVNGTCDQGCVDGYKPPDCLDQCDTGFYGPNCSLPCNQRCTNQTCNATNGDCDACIPGYLAPKCEECPDKTYGIDCQQECSANCVDQICDNVNGKCKACPPGKQGDFCDSDCNPGKFGHGCLEDCSDNCAGQGGCNPQNGTCQEGCEEGYQYSLCNETCNPRTFGADCRMNCSQFCKEDINKEPSVCHHETGVCLSGCQSGREGPTCASVIQDSDIGNIVGPIVVVILLAVIVFIGIFVWRRRKKSVSNKLLDNGNRADVTETGIAGPEQVRMRGIEPSTRSEKQTKDANGSESRPPTQSGDQVYYNALPGPYKTSIAVEELNNFMRIHNKEYFEEQFKKVPTSCNAPMSIGISTENKHKNRYKNISAYDHSRVQLVADVTKKHGDYINASYVQGYKADEQFIASQGPNKVILEDFVRMLWEHKIDKVVMLTNLIEEGKSKCERYWPEEDEAEFGEIRIRLATTQVFADYTIRRLQLMKVGRPTHSLTHFHFTSWPDKGVPTTPWSLVDFEQRVASYPTTKPIVVHCSAGVGRTGTFIALRNVMREAEATGHMDFYTTLWKLRQDRVYMIQTVEQYMFLHEAAQVAMVCIGTTVTSVNILDRIDLLERVSGSGQTNMEKEFKAVCHVCADKQGVTGEEDEGDGVNNTYMNSRSASNKLKNRFSNILPKEFYRPYLSCETRDLSDYINAVLLPSFIKQNQQILTQLPLPTTVLDFWRLVTQYKVSLIVAFEADATDDVTIGHYLPQENEPMQVGSFDIETQPVTRDTLWEKQNLCVTIHKKKKTRLSTSSSHSEEHHLTHLKCPVTGLNRQQLLKFVSQVRSCRQKEGKILYMCRNGADYSGLVCVLNLLLDRIDNDHCLTVPLVVGAIKTIRPQVIPTLEQYRSLYEVLRKYHESNNVYCNFKDGTPSSKPGRGDQMSGDSEEDANVYANS